MGAMMSCWLPPPGRPTLDAITIDLPVPGAGIVPGARSAVVMEPSLTLSPVTAPFLMLLVTTRFLPILWPAASATPAKGDSRASRETPRAAYATGLGLVMDRT